MASMSTWTGLRGDEGRTWVRFSDLADAAARAGFALSRYEIRQAIAHLAPPQVKRYGHHHYTRDHLDAVVALARRYACQQMSS